MPKMNSETRTVFIQIIERPQRKLILRRGLHARDYFAYCDEVGCSVWDQLTAIREALHEPMGLWLPPTMIREGTSLYVQGVEVGMDFSAEIPENFEIIELPPCHLMVFQGQPYDDEMFPEAIGELQETIAAYDPSHCGYAWADELAPRFQLIPLGYRGYIEGRPVKALGNCGSLPAEKWIN